MNEELIPVGTVLTKRYNPETDSTYWEMAVPGDDELMVFESLEYVMKFLNELRNLNRYV